ncbi:MAG TPA: hypothetical protein DEA96_16605 [Leptospiraceae bacterium]|nr:hypothetical protein [Spirochaetaceae bacterium]HBS06592.1 hypothetical protein [Leptospiraceae bacterium]
MSILEKLSGSRTIALFCVAIALLIFAASVLSGRTEYQWGSAPVSRSSLIRYVEWIAFLLGFLLAICIRNQARFTEKLYKTKSLPVDTTRPQHSDFEHSRSGSAARVILGRFSPFQISLYSGYAIVGMFVIYLGLYYKSAYDSFYLQEHDFLNIAAALPHTGLLQTPYVNTGPSGSFLGHHFSPFLILLKPIFWLCSQVPGANYGIYMLPLFLGASWGTILWYELAIKYVSRQYFWLLPVLALFLGFNPLLFRLSLSFHFEVFILPLAAACLLTWNHKSYWVFLFLLLSVKEDISLYSLLICGSLYVTGRWNVWKPSGERIPRSSSSSGSILHRRLLISAILSALYFLIAVTAQRFLAGSSGADWSHYWLDAFEWKGAQTTGFLVVILSGGWLALKERGLRIPFILILLMHVFSRHPWHNSFQSHYVYTVIIIVLISVYYLKPGVLSIMVPAMLFAAILDKSTPQALLLPARHDTLVVTERIPQGSCVRASRHIAVRVPLHSKTFPIYSIAGNPLSGDLCQPPGDETCKGAYLLLESQDTPRLHGCQMQSLRFRAGTEHLNLFEYVKPGR